jgi:branched-subunit amino acid aminotransferase/4-amino-4-deoxychorismate lyase
MGSGPILGLAPAPEYTFLIYAAPVGNYFKVSARTSWTRSLRPGDET